MRTRTIIGLLAVTTAACSGSGSGPTAAPTNAVQATAQLAFSPNVITVAQGSAVSFVFGSAAHTVKFQNGSDESATFFGGATSTPGAPADIGQSQNATVSRVFDTTGTFHYRCTIHPNMTGEVHVR